MVPICSALQGICLIDSLSSRINIEFQAHTAPVFIVVGGEVCIQELMYIRAELLAISKSCVEPRP